MERNKVMSFGEPSTDPVEMADGFMVGGPLWPPPWNIGLKINIRPSYNSETTVC